MFFIFKENTLYAIEWMSTCRLDVEKGKKNFNVEWVKVGNSRGVEYVYVGGDGIGSGLELELE